MNSQLLTTQEAAAILRLSRQSVCVLCNEKKLKCIRHSERGKRLIYSDSVEAVGLVLQDDNKRAEFEAACRREREALSQTRRIKEQAAKRRLAKNSTPDAIAKSFRRQAEKHLQQIRIDRSTIAQTKLALKRFNATCLDHAMPPVPPPKHRAIDVGSMQCFPGVYFAWDGLLCSYVGESCDVPRRVKNHQKFGQGTWISFIETHQHKRYEHFYIWLLNPYDNGGMA